MPRAREIDHPGSGLTLLTLITIFGKLRRSMLNCSNSSRVGQNGPLYKNGENVSHFRKISSLDFALAFSYYLPDRLAGSQPLPAST